MLATAVHRNIKCLVLIILTILFSVNPISSLQCRCNVCTDSDFCEEPNDRESFCYKSVDKILENDTYVLVESYGCLSGKGGSIAHLQCFANNLRHFEPNFIKCCRDSDYCNENLGNPSEQDDTRWKLDPPVTPRVDGFYVDFWLVVLCLSTLGILCIVIRLIVISRLCSRGTSDSDGSVCSLKADLDKFHHQHAASSSVSTHSYSVSDDLCHKPGPSNDVSLVHEEFTSGPRDGKVLNMRTMARVVRSSQTDHVGNGRFGRVFRGQYHGEDVAVKAFRSVDEDSWRREDTIFRTLNHENIVRFIASEISSVENAATELWMFLEYCPFGSLCDYLDHNEVLGPQQAIKILYSIINGLNYLHEDYAQMSRLYKPSIAHRDMKSKNILMKTPDTCCIADFGHALIKLDEATLDYGKYQHLQVGTIRYMAPEILRPNSNLNYRHFSTFAQADLYQYGLILWEVCHRTALDILHPAGNHKLPYDGVVPQNPDIQDMIKIVCDDQYRPPRYDKWEKYPLMKCLANLMVECWRPNSKARMETLGVKKKLKEMHDQILPTIRQQFQMNLFNYSSSSSYNSKNDRDKTKSDVTL